MSATVVYTVWLDSITQYGDTVIRSGPRLIGTYPSEAQARQAVEKQTQAGDYEIFRAPERIADRRILFKSLAGAPPKRKPAAAHSES